MENGCGTRSAANTTAMHNATPNNYHLNNIYFLVTCIPLFRQISLKKTPVHKADVLIISVQVSSLYIKVPPHCQ